MFKEARLKLTLWYLVIIFSITSLFSLAFYKVSTREIRRIANHIQNSQQEGWTQKSVNPLPPPDEPTLEDLQASEKRLFISLLVINGVVLLVSGRAAYFLAARTLSPIKEMIDEQNQFVSNSSHELRTPLATLRAEMEANLLEKKISDRKARRLIKSNLEELGKLQALSNNLLRLAKLHKPTSEKKEEKVSMKEVISLAVKRVSPLAKKKQITVKTDLEEALVKGEKESFEELMVILLDNAIKYSKKESKIEVKSQRLEKKVLISVKDKGIGIPEKDLDHIFERFFRSDASRSKIEGFGLGLSIAKQIVDKGKGSIEVDSKLGKGSTFKIELPLAKA